MKAKFISVMIVVLTCSMFSGCGEKITEEQGVTIVESVESDKSDIVNVKTCKFKVNVVPMISDFYSYYDIYWDKVTNTCYAKLDAEYGGIIIELLDRDGTPKSYSEDNKNELNIIDNGDFYIFENTDTGIQYIVTYNYSDYIVRRTETGELYQ